MKIAKRIKGVAKALFSKKSARDFLVGASIGAYLSACILTIALLILVVSICLIEGITITNVFGAAVYSIILFSFCYWQYRGVKAIQREYTKEQVVENTENTSGSSREFEFSLN